MSTVIVVGGGFSGLSAATHLASQGCQVTLLEKNESLGGRARQYTSDGFRFDMGPSWYWMPDVFERYYSSFDTTASEHYDLKLLDPGFRVYYGSRDYLDIPADQGQLRSLFDSIEPGTGAALGRFLSDAKYKYEVGMHDLVYRPGLSPLEFLEPRLLKSMNKLHLTTPFDHYVQKYFRDDRLRRLMEFPILFLGASPAKTPALYSLMNYAGLVLGTWYPQGGMHKIVEAMTTVAISQGVQIQTNTEVNEIISAKGMVKGVRANNAFIDSEYVVASADYHHVDRALLENGNANYSEKYWDRRQMSPSSLLFYIGVDRKVPGLIHHNLFFDADFNKHIEAIYDQPQWPEDPLFYVCSPSKTDPTVAPEGMENMFILIPLAAGLKDDMEMRKQIFNIVADRLEKSTGVDIRNHIVHFRSYAMNDFKKDYYAFKGNAYGLANTLRQTAFLKPRLKNRNVKNLYYTGHLTVPGPGVPPSLISGKIVADLIMKNKHAANL